MWQLDLFAAIIIVIIMAVAFTFVHSDDKYKETTEVHGTNYKNDTDEWFACSNGKLIQAKWKCNGYLDCPNGTDESTTTCGDDYCRLKLYFPQRKGDSKRLAAIVPGFTCASGECIRREYRCEGTKTCDDGSDESTETCGADCEKVEGRWACSSGQCIMERNKCDGWRTCADGSDETTEVCGANCQFVNNLLFNTRGGFACSNGQCIKAEFKCDGKTDCKDGSDETTDVCVTNKPS